MHVQTTTTSMYIYVPPEITTLLFRRMEMDDGPLRNRRERRAMARDTGNPVTQPMSTPEVKLQQPERCAPRAQTLLDLYEEKKRLPDKAQPLKQIRDDGLADDENGNILEAGLGDDEPIGPIGNAIFWSISLAAIHFTLDVLVYNQYSQRMDWNRVSRRALMAMPMLFLVLSLLTTQTASRFPLLKQVIFLTIGIGAGCYVIYAANSVPYLAVMKQAPPLGTLWIWSVLEMRLEFAVASLLANLAYLWYYGFSIV